MKIDEMLLKKELLESKILKLESSLHEITENIKKWTPYVGSQLNLVKDTLKKLINLNPDYLTNKNARYKFESYIPQGDFQKSYHKTVYLNDEKGCELLVDWKWGIIFLINADKNIKPTKFDKIIRDNFPGKPLSDNDILVYNPKALLGGLVFRNGKWVDAFVSLVELLAFKESLRTKSEISKQIKNMLKDKKIRFSELIEEDV